MLNFYYFFFQIRIFCCQAEEDADILIAKTAIYLHFTNSHKVAEVFKDFDPEGLEGSRRSNSKQPENLFCKVNSRKNSPENFLITKLDQNHTNIQRTYF